MGESLTAQPQRPVLNGTVEKGKLADLVVLAADPTADVKNWRRIRFVVRAGQPKTPAELREPR